MNSNSYLRQLKLICPFEAAFEAAYEAATYLALYGYYLRVVQLQMDFIFEAIKTHISI